MNTQNAQNVVDDALEAVQQVLIRCTVMGVIVLLIWWGALELAGGLSIFAPVGVKVRSNES